MGLITEVLTSWDGKWYFEIIRRGYPKVIPPDVTWDMLEARAAFFPVFPTLARWFDWVLPGGEVLAAVLLNFLLGAGVVYVVGLLAHDLFSSRVAYRSMLLVIFFPGSFVLTFTYSEASLLLLTTLCLLMLQRERWLLAGVFAALGTAARPNGLTLVAASAVAAFLAIRTKRAWASLVAPALAPLGFVGFQTYLRVFVRESGHHCGTTRGLGRRRRLRADRDQELTRRDHPSAHVADRHPHRGLDDRHGDHGGDDVEAAPAVAVRRLHGGRARSDAPPDTVTARPRFLLTAFPAFISVAAWWPDEHEEAWDALLAMCGAGLVTLTELQRLGRP